MGHADPEPSATPGSGGEEFAPGRRVLLSFERALSFGTDRIAERTYLESPSSGDNPLVKHWDNGPRGVVSFDAPPGVIAVRAPRIAVDLRMVSGFTLGVAPIVWHSSETQSVSYIRATSDTWVGGAAPRVGYLLSLSSETALWFKAQLPVTYATASVDSAAYNKGLGRSESSTYAVHYLTVGLSLAPSFVIGTKTFAMTFTPDLDLPIAGSRWKTSSDPLSGPSASYVGALAFGLSLGLVLAL